MIYQGRCTYAFQDYTVKKGRKFEMNTKFKTNYFLIPSRANSRLTALKSYCPHVINNGFKFPTLTFDLKLNLGNMC